MVSVRETLCDVYTEQWESHYVGVLDNPQSRTMMSSNKLDKGQDYYILVTLNYFLNYAALSLQIFRVAV